jgi:hypothetical protein
MSTMRVNAIRSISGTSDAIALNSTGGVEAINGAAYTAANNLIINGSMQMYARSTGSGYTGATAYVLDRWISHNSGTDEHPTVTKHDLTAAGDALPWADGLRFSYHLQNGNQTSGVGAGDYIGIIQHVEANLVRNFGWSFKDSSDYITLSFWVKSSVAQNFYGYIRTQTGTTQAYVFETGNLTADTWTKVTKTIPGGADVAFNDSTSAGLSLYLHTYWGTNFTGSVTLNQWANFNSSARTPNYGTANDDWYVTNDATFELTGVQIETGQVANTFKPEPFDELKLRCERYYEKSYSNANGPGTNTASGMVINRFGSSAITNRTDMSCRFRVEKRATPSMTVYSKVGTSGKCSDFETGVTHVADRTVDAILTISPLGTLGLDMNTGQDDALAFHYVADAEM